MFKVDPNATSMSGRRTLLCAKADKPIGQLRPRKWGSHAAVYIGTNDDEKTILLKEKNSLDFRNKNATILQGGTNGTEVGDVSGNWKAKEFSVKLSGTEVAKITRKSMTLQGVLAGADSYYLTIQPGVDMALVVLLTVGADELVHDKNNY